MKYILPFLMVIVLFLIAGCAPSVGTQAPDDTPREVDNGDEVAPSPPQKEPTAEVKELLEKHNPLKSVQYLMDTGLANTFTVYLRGDKLKKEITRSRYEAITADFVYYNTVYVDRVARTAYTHCIFDQLCPALIRDQALVLDFEDEDIITPIQIIEGVTYAEKVGQERFDNRDTIILEYTNDDGKRERLWVETFFGLPLQQRIYDGDEVAERRTFTRVSFNSVKDDDVTLPDTYE